MSDSKNSFKVDVPKLNSSSEGSSSSTMSMMSYNTLSQSSLFTFVVTTLVCFILLSIMKPAFVMKNGSYNTIASIIISVFVGLCALFVKIKL